MLKHYLQQIKAGHLRALREQKGQSLIIFTFAFLGLIGMLGLALDLGLVYIEQVRVGRTADAAALAAVVELPSEEEAIKRAIEFIELNGYNVTGTNPTTQILVRGCVKQLPVALAVAPSTVISGNVSELGVVDHPAPPPGTLLTITPTTEITGALRLPVLADPEATFMVDTYSYQTSEDGNCDTVADSEATGDAQKIQVRGLAEVDMNFMQFFGFSEVPVQDVAVAENITQLDVAVVFDISASMEFETTCYDCWVRTNLDNPDYPNNGYYNPLPYNPDWATGEPHSIPHSDLCVQAPAVITDSNDNLYLSHEAELYSYNRGDWRFAARVPGQGFWVLQRGSRAETNDYNPYDDNAAEFPDLYPHYQGNQAGNVAGQSSNVCHPGIAGSGIECKIDGEDICDASDGENATIDDTGGVTGGVDCSAYIKAHPFPTYGAQNAGSLQGAAYDSTCWTQARCWDNNTRDDPSRPSPNTAPFVEYDFTPRWSGDTHIWIRAAGGGDRSTRWVGAVAASLPALWRTAVHWGVYQTGTASNPANVQSDGEDDDGTGNPPNGLRPAQSFRDNRADEHRWRWIKLGTAPTAQDVQHTLRIYQGSAGYKIDKIVFTNGNDDGQVENFLQSGDDKGPPATNGSATRESCNFCNPAYGLNIADMSECGCPANATEAANYVASGASGSGAGCSAGPGNRLENDLYRGVEPLRSAQEAVKDFAKRLDTKFDQIGIVAFGTDIKGKPLRSTDLHCSVKTNGNCEEESPEVGFRPALEAVERQWPENLTNISGGLRQGLIELGVEDFAADLNCSGAPDSSCGRIGARKILILMTDGAPTARAYDQCRANRYDIDKGQLIDRDLWEVGVGAEDADYECAMHYAKLAAESGVTVYTIGIGSGVDADLLTAMAEGRVPGQQNALFSARGGKFFDAASPSDLESIFTEILGNIYVRIR